MELKEPLETIWKDHSEESWGFFCPHCRHERRIPFKPRPTPRHYAQIAICSAFFTLLAWKWLSWKGIVSFLPLWTGFEIIYRSRVRAALACSHCGFDPYLYLVDVSKARSEVESHWRKKFEEKGIPYPEKKPAPPL